MSIGRLLDVFWYLSFRRPRDFFKTFNVSTDDVPGVSCVLKMFLGRLLDIKHLWYVNWTNIRRPCNVSKSSLRRPKYCAYRERLEE